MRPFLSRLNIERLLVRALRKWTSKSSPAPLRPHAPLLYLEHALRKNRKEPSQEVELRYPLVMPHSLQRPSASTGSEFSNEDIRRASTSALAFQALLREHSNALVCALDRSGIITDMPSDVSLQGHEIVEGRAMIDFVITADRHKVIQLWTEVVDEGKPGSVKVRLIKRQEIWTTAGFFDTRALYGVVLGILIPTDEPAGEEKETENLAPARPRLCTILEDEVSTVLDIDEAYTQMFGYTLADVIGQRVLDQIHPDDQGRAIEGWLQMLSTKRVQATRLRRKIKDGGWVWVDTTLHNFLDDPERKHVLVEIIDVSAEMKAQEKAQEQAELLRRLVDSLPDGVLQIDTERKIVFHNTRLLDIFCCTSDNIDTLVGDKLSLSFLMRHVTRESLLSFNSGLDEVLSKGIDRDIEVEITSPSGKQRRALMSIRTLHSSNGEVHGAISSVLDVTDSARVRKELERRATTDPLTGLLNRASLQSQIAALSKDDAVYSSVGLIMLDIDHFKKINDTYGHKTGDLVLQDIALIIRSQIRASDFIFRIGGEEFLLLLPGVTNELAHALAESLRRSVVEATFPNGLHVTVTCGVSVSATGKAFDYDTTFSEADRALYEGKRTGRNRVIDAPECPSLTAIDDKAVA